MIAVLFPPLIFEGPIFQSVIQGFFLLHWKKKKKKCSKKKTAEAYSHYLLLFPFDKIMPEFGSLDPSNLLQGKKP